MNSISRQSGLTIVLPPGYRLADAETQDDLADALSKAGLQALDVVELRPEGVAAEATIEFAAVLAAHEDAVLLVEQEGFYAWKFADEIETATADRTTAETTLEPPRRRATFRVALGTPGPDTGAAHGRAGFDGVESGELKAWVLKFSGRVAVGQAIKFLERDIGRGVRVLTGADPSRWELERDLSSFVHPPGRPARFLLLLHGTFASTVGAFGALGATPWGRAFLEAALQHYDAVLGFDHATLGEDPLANAAELLDLLRAVEWDAPPHFDVVTHGRGALVFRSLVEHLLPVSGWKAHFDRAVFVGAPHAGTALAEPENWKTLIDLYTNLAVAAWRLLGMIPQSPPAAADLAELLKGLGAFVKFCATQSADERGVPGLAAQTPGGAFIRALNGTQAGQPTVETSYYCAVTSEFRPRHSDGGYEPREMPRRFVRRVTETLTKELMGGGHDLFVNVALMKAVEGAGGRFIKDSLDFGENPQVYHTAYFVRPEVVNALTRWLRLAEPKTGLPGRRGRFRSDFRPARDGGTLRGGARREGKSPSRIGFRGEQPEVSADAATAWRRLSRLGAAVTPDVPANVDTDIISASADATLGKCLECIAEKTPSYVVVRRDYEGRTLNYAFPAEEIISLAEQRPEKSPLVEALDLHERDASVSRSVFEAAGPPDAPTGRDTTARQVILAGGKPVGVLPEKKELPSVAELSEMVRTVSKAGTISAAVGATVKTSRILTRRAMPSFERPPAAPERSVRGARRGGRAAPAIACHFHAEMEAEVVLNTPTVVQVFVSREALGRATGPSAQGARADVDPGRNLLVQVVPKLNFEAFGESRRELPPPAPGEPARLAFVLEPKHEGDGEAWVMVRQGQVPLATLVLKSRIVRERGASVRPVAAEAVTSEAPRLIEPLHQLRIHERESGGQIFYEFELQSPALNTLTPPLVSGPLKGDRQKYVEELYKQIEKAWIVTEEDAQAFADDLRAMGGEMFSELVPREIQEILWEHRDRIDSIMVLSTEPFIPWELVYLKEPNKRGAKGEGKFLGQMGLIRWLHGVGWPPDVVRIREGRARFCIPHYPHPDYVLAEAQKEEAFLARRFGATRVEPQPVPVRELISEPGQFDLLHFACHGFAEQDNISNAELMLEGRMEGGEYVKTSLNARVAKEFSDLETPDNRPMITLNSCQTGRSGYNLTGLGGFADAFLHGGAGAFVGALWSVGDQPARTFTETLYEALLSGSNLSRAAVAARDKTRLAEEGTWLAYAVYGHPHMKVARS